MKVPPVTYFFLFCATVTASDRVVTKHALDEIVFPTDEIHALKSFTKFLKLVEDNKMNVSIVVSTSDTYSNGQPRESSSYAVTWSFNKLAETNSTLDKSQRLDFLKTATEDKLAAKATLVEEENSKIWTNKLDGLPVSEAHRLLTTINNARTGFVWDDENFISHYTFVSPGLDGKNKTVKLFYGDLNIETVNFKNVSEADIKWFKKVLSSAYFTYPLHKIPIAVSFMLERSHPDIFWQVVTNVGANSYINAKTSITLKLQGINYLIFHT